MNKKESLNVDLKGVQPNTGKITGSYNGPPPTTMAVKQPTSVPAPKPPPKSK